MFQLCERGPVDIDGWRRSHDGGGGGDTIGMVVVTVVMAGKDGGWLMQSKLDTRILKNLTV